MRNDRCSIPGVWYSAFDLWQLVLGWLAGERSRRKRTTTTMPRVNPWGENQALHLIHRARCEAPWTRIKVGWGTPEPPSQEGKRTGRDCKTRDSGASRGTVESPGFSRGECQNLAFKRLATVCRNWLLDPPPVKKTYQQEQVELLAFLNARYGVNDPIPEGRGLSRYSDNPGTPGKPFRDHRPIDCGPAKDFALARPSLAGRVARSASRRVRRLGNWGSGLPECL